MSKSKPEVVYRIGYVSASVWRQDGQKPFHIVNLQRSYRNDGGETKYADTFSLGDLANVQRVLAKAQEYIEKADMHVAPE